MAHPDRLGDFEIADELGRGGFGVVYRGRQVSLDRPVAVKVLYRHLVHTDEQISRFEREARAAARLDHPAIVAVYAWGGADDDFYIAQRLVGSGRTLHDELEGLRRGGELPRGWFRTTAERLALIADGLQQAHERGIVHRDVKPGNILIDDEGRPFLGDFGLAKVEDGLELSRTGDFAGSPYYMSPEQADGRRGPIDPRTDVYSLGVTLYEMITLQQPHSGASSHEIIRKILADEPRRPSRLEERVPADLETICLHAMEKDPARRYQTAGEFAADLRAFLDGESIAAVPIGGLSRMARSIRRHRQPIALSLLGAIVVVGGLWATKSLSSARTQVQQASTGETLQSQRADELGHVQEEFSKRMQDAAQRQDVDEVSRIAAQQQAATALLNEQYNWVRGQLSEIGDTEALQTVTAGIATRGVVGGLESLQQVLLTRRAASEREALMLEVGKRVSAIQAALGAGDAQGADALPSAAALSDLSKMTMRFFRGQLYLLPVDLLPGAVPAGEGAAPAAPDGAPPPTPAEATAP